MRFRFAVVLAVAVAASAEIASAADYTVTLVQNRYEAIPANAPDPLAGTGQGRLAGAHVDLPFTFIYYGGAYDRIWVGSRGTLQAGVLVGGNSLDNEVFPVTAQNDGLIAACWDQSSAKKVSVWTAGTAPNRRFIVAWDVVTDSSTPNKWIYFEAILYEGSGRIVIAFTETAQNNGWFPFATQLSWVAGIDAPGDARWFKFGNGANGKPVNDFQLDPATVTVSGRAQYDRIVADASGIGNSVEAGLPAAGLRVELRTFTKTAAVAYCDASGQFALNVAAPLTGTVADVHLLADDDACRVVPVAGGSATSLLIGGPYSLAANVDAGTLTADATVDPAGTSRAAFDVATTVAGAAAWSAAHSTASIAKIDVVYEPGSAAATAYTPAAAPAAASLRVGSAASGNDDGWDRAVVVRHYGRHVLAAVSALPVTAADLRFDAATSPENAFAEAFCYYLSAVRLGGRLFVDALDATHATILDLEDPQPVSPAGPDVAAWVTKILYDTVDKANEVEDRIDGTTGGSDRVLRVVDSLTAAPTATSFFAAWLAAGYDAPAIRRLYIANGFIADDASEPNDDGGEPTASAAPGWLRTGLTLNPDNEDWFSVPLAAASDAILVDMAFARAGNAAQVLVEIRDDTGAVRGTAMTQSGFAPVHCVSNAVAPGTYRIRVAHLSGPVISPYSIQVFRRISIGPAEFPEWTVGRPYAVPLDIDGGVPPITLSTPQGSPPPNGLVVDSAHVRVSGTPAAPGQYSVSILAQDSGSPVNLFTTSRNVVLNPPLTLGLGEFVAFPLGRALATGVRSTGGTAPRTFTVTDGTLPGGVTLRADALEFTGTAASAGSGRFGVRGADVAGSEQSGAVLGVVCVPSQDGGAAMTLAEGDSAAGFFFDAVAGSAVSVAVKAAKKQAKRVLGGAVLAPDGTTAVDGAKVKGGAGKWSASGVVCPVTGRYFVVIGSPGGAEAQMLGSVKIAPPKSAKAPLGRVTQGDRLSIFLGALAGAKLTLKAVPEKKSDLVIGVQTLIDPTGAFVAPGTAATAVGNGVALTIVLPKAGTWTVVLSAKSGAGDLSYTAKIAQPKGGVFVLE